ncbi:MAG: ComEA family DNA-binding protein [Cyclobacteriaceae bacterium]
MKSKGYLFCLLASLQFYALVLQGQSVRELEMEKLLEPMIQADYGEDADVEGLYENLIQFYQDPLNLNAATAEDLRLFFLLSERQISNLIRYRLYYGPLLSVYELAMIPAWDKETIARLLPFVTVAAIADRRLALKERFAQAANRYVILRQSRVLERARGYSLSDSLSDHEALDRFRGSPDQLYTRMRIYRPGSLSLGFTMEKDAGERLAFDTAEKYYGSDFTSAHFYIEKAGPIERLALGDFTFQSGQQLVFGGGFGIGKGGMSARAVGQSQWDIRPYTSATESNFMRGAALTLRLPAGSQHLYLTAIRSSAPRNARLRLDDEREEVYFRGFDQTGLHRSAAELERRQSLRENGNGLNLHFSNRLQHWQMGLNYFSSRFSHPMYPRQDLYRRHDFTGSSYQAGSAYFSYAWSQWRTFGEAALSEGGGQALLAGLGGAINSYAETVLLYRNYSPDYVSFYGNAFGESSRNANEEGLYWGWQMEPLKYTKVAAFYDVFRFPWLRFRVDAPSAGYEYFVRLDQRIKREAQLTLQYRRESKARNISEDSLFFNRVDNGIRSNLMLMLDYKVNELLSLRTRLHSGSYALADSLSRGWVVAQDASLEHKQWKANVRFALFSTDDFNTRQYLYEHDLLYAFSVPAYAGLGMRYYLLLRYKLNRHWSFWARYSQTVFHDRENIGSGQDLIEGNRRSQLRMQAILKF